MRFISVCQQKTLLTLETLFIYLLLSRKLGSFGCSPLAEPGFVMAGRRHLPRETLEGIARVNVPIEGRAADPHVLSQRADAKRRIVVDRTFLHLILSHSILSSSILFGVAGTNH